MERRHFLKIAFGFAAGAAALASAAKAAGAAPLAPQSLPLQGAPDPAHEPRSALANQNDLDGAHVEQVRWHRRHRRHWRWHRRRHWHGRRW